MIRKVTGIDFDKKGAAPGKTVLIKTEAAGNQELNRELYHPPGISSAPTKNDRAIEVDAGGNVKVIVATHNYRIEVEPEAGETIIYSTNADGSTKQAEVKLTPSGDIELNGNTKSFVTHAELNTALQTFITALNLHTHPTAATGPPSPPTVGMSLDISTAETTTIKTGG